MYNFTGTGTQTENNWGIELMLKHTKLFLLSYDGTDFEDFASTNHIHHRQSQIMGSYLGRPFASGSVRCLQRIFGHFTINLFQTIFQNK